GVGRHALAGAQPRLPRRGAKPDNLARELVPHHQRRHAQRVVPEVAAQLRSADPRVGDFQHHLARLRLWLGLLAHGHCARGLPYECFHRFSFSSCSLFPRYDKVLPNVTVWWEREGGTSPSHPSLLAAVGHICDRQPPKENDLGGLAALQTSQIAKPIAA